jgi:SPP1 family phage portal protein
MVLQKTSKEVLSTTDILKYIQDYETTIVPHLNDLWEYYKGKNVKILNRKTPDPNNPDNRIVVSYGRKIVVTYTGYAYRPKYITYKPNIKKETEEIENDEFSDGYDSQGNRVIVPDPIEKVFVNELQNIYNINNEHIKTNRAGRNSVIFGFAYEVCYIDSEIQPIDSTLPIKAIPRFFSVDPREMIVLYDFSPEPKIKIAIRFYQMEDKNSYKVEVYYKDHTEIYKRVRSDDYGKWMLINEGSYYNYYDNVPVAAYYRGDEMQSIMENVLTIIDAHDVLFSDSMNEFDRFAFAYMIMKKFGLTDPIAKKDPTKTNWALKLLKQRRVFEHLDKDAEISFLTKDIPTEFIAHIGAQLREQIHIQSHVPDFTDKNMAGTSGIAIQKLTSYDFENIVSSDEADFDTGLYMRMSLMITIMKKLGIVDGTTDMVLINHKRNVPLNNQEFAQTALLMQNGGFSRRAIVGIMPEEIIPDIEKELEYEKEEQEAMIGLENINNPIDVPVDETNQEEGA